MKRTVSGLVLTLLLLGTFTLAFDIRRAYAQTTIYINSNGRVTPSSAPISSVDNITYTLTGNISYPTYNGIVVRRSNIVINGNGHTVQGNGTGSMETTSCGLNVTDLNNVTIRNINIKNFGHGIYLYNSNDSTISANKVTSNSYEGILLDYSSYNTISGNTVSANVFCGIYLSLSSDNIITGNNVIANTFDGICLSGGNSGGSDNNVVSRNNVTSNGSDGITIDHSSYNTISWNRVNNNSIAIYVEIISGSNTVFGNNIIGNVVGIYLSDVAVNNIITENNVTSSRNFNIGVGWGCPHNLIFHNSFVNGKLHQAGASESTSAWDDGYPSGGNYWSDYSGKDLYKGPYQNITGSDGIGDTPYLIPNGLDGSYARDRYPLMHPYKAPPLAFAVKASQSNRIVCAGSSTTYTVTASFLSGQTDLLNWSASGLPSGATCSFTPPWGYPTFNYTLGITTSKATPPGTYTITITGRAQSVSNSTKVTLRVYNFTVSPSPFSPNGDGVKDNTTISATFWASIKWSLFIANSANTVIRSLGSGTGSSLSMKWNGKDSSGIVVPDGVYKVILNGTGFRNILSVIVDDTPPTVTGTSVFPTSFNPKSGQTTRINCTLSESCYVTIKIYNSTGALKRTLLDSVLQTNGFHSFVWNGKDSSNVIVRDGTYTIKIYILDKAGNKATPYPTVKTVVVDTTPPVVTGVSVYPTSFKPGLGQTTRLNYTLSESCYVTVRIYNSTGTLKITLVANVLQTSGFHSLVWNGKDSSNAVMPPGTYNMKIYVIDKAGNKATPYPITKTVTVV